MRSFLAAPFAMLAALLLALLLVAVFVGSRLHGQKWWF